MQWDSCKSNSSWPPPVEESHSKHNKLHHTWLHSVHVTHLWEFRGDFSSGRPFAGPAAGLLLHSDWPMCWYFIPFTGFLNCYRNVKCFLCGELVVIVWARVSWTTWFKLVIICNMVLGASVYFLFTPAMWKIHQNAIIIISFFNVLLCTSCFVLRHHDRGSSVAYSYCGITAKVKCTPIMQSNGLYEKAGLRGMYNNTTFEKYKSIKQLCTHE